MPSEQLFHAPDQPIDRKWLDQIFHIVLLEEAIDLWVGGKTGNEDEAITDVRPDLEGPEKKLVSAQTRHHDVAHDRVVKIGPQFEDGFFAIMGDIDQEIFVRQNP